MLAIFSIIVEMSITWLESTDKVCQSSSARHISTSAKKTPITLSRVYVALVWLKLKNLCSCSASCVEFFTFNTCVWLSNESHLHRPRSKRHTKFTVRKEMSKEFLSIREFFEKILEKEISKLSRPLDSLWTLTFLSPARLKAAPTLIIDYRTRLICSEFSRILFIPPLYFALFFYSIVWLLWR